MDNRELREVDTESQLLHSDIPGQPGFLGLCRYQQGAVHVDGRSGRIEFHNCFRPHRFLGARQTLWVSSRDSLRAVHGRPNKIGFNFGYLIVVTSEGKAAIPPNASNYAKLQRWFSDAVPSNDPAYFIHCPEIGFVYVLGAALGLLLAYFISWDLSDGMMLASVLLGPVLGVVAGYATVWAGWRYFNADFARPLAGLYFGVHLALFAFVTCSVLLEWDERIMVAMLIAGGLIGLMVGIKTRTRTAASGDRGSS
jgi:hypothetical protein